MHHTQLPSTVQSCLQPGAGNRDLLRVHFQGFIDYAILAERLEQLAGRVEQLTPDALLCDLRSVSGYGPGIPDLAREWLMLVCRAGIRRVALVATSSVLRTHALLLARDLDLDLRCFLGESEAQRWLSS